jgi:hypothetical protein
MSTPEKPEVYAKEWEEWCQKPEGELRKFKATGTPYQSELASEVLRCFDISARKKTGASRKRRLTRQKAANVANGAFVVSIIALIVSLFTPQLRSWVSHLWECLPFAR